MAGQRGRRGAGGRGATPPGRRARQKAEREGRILRAAQALFARRGYTQTGVGDIARRAKLAVGTLYNYFPSKAEIALALLRQEIAATLAAGEGVVAEPPADPAEAVVALLDVYVDLVLRHPPGQLRELLATAVAQPDTIGRAVFEMDLRLLGQLHALLERLRERGALPGGVETGRAATTLYGVYLTWLLVFAASGALPAERLRDEVRRGALLVLRGMLPPRKPGRPGPPAPPRPSRRRRGRSDAPLRGE